MQARSVFDAGEGAPTNTIKAPYTSNYGWISKNFRYQVVNLDGTVSVQYDDGDFGIGVRAPFIERVAKRLHPIWVAKQKDSGIESESAGGLASGSKNSERLNKKKREGIISGSWPIRTLRSVNWDVCAVVAMFFFFMIFAVWLALRLVPRPKRVISVACGMVLARAVYVLAIEGF